MNLSLGLKTIAKRYPGCPAVEWEGGTLTYSEFEHQVSEPVSYTHLRAHET